MHPSDPNFGKSAQLPIQRNDVVPPVDAGSTVDEIDVDRAFDDMATPVSARASRMARVKEALQPRVQDARAYLAQHRVATTLLGFGLGFALGRLLRRS